MVGKRRVHREIKRKNASAHLNKLPKHHRLSTFRRQRRILVDVHLVSPWQPSNAVVILAGPFSEAEIDDAAAFVKMANKV